MTSTYRVDILESKLQELTNSVVGIRGTVIVSVEGFVVASHFPAEPVAEPLSGDHTPQVAAMAATLIALGEQTLARLSQGRIERLIVEGDSGAMIVYPINENAALTVMADKTAKMGITLLSISRAADYFASVLSGTK